MAGLLQLAEQSNPTGQTFVVDEASCLTGIGIFFAKAPADDNYAITLEMRPTTESGSPSAQRYIPGTRVTATAAQIRTKTDPGGVYAGTTFSDAREYKFEFKHPIYVPNNSLCSFVVYTSAPAGQYQMYVAKNVDFLYGSTEAFYTYSTSTEKGAFYSSSNGTSWEPDNNKDVTFKVYRAQFNTTTVSRAVLNNNIIPVKRLTETQFRTGLGHYTYDPIGFTSGSNIAKIRHPVHSFQPGDKVTLSSDGVNSFDSGDTINGVVGSSILGQRTIVATDPFGYTITMDSNADSTVRGGGTGLMATENFGIDQAYLTLPYITPKKTNLAVKIDLTTSKSQAGTENAYNTTTDIRLHPNKMHRLLQPHMIATADNEALRLSGNKSAKMTVSMYTTSPNVAPYFNIDTAYLGCEQALIDNQSSYVRAGYNTLASVDWVSDSASSGGTDAAQHTTIPYKLETGATSIVVYTEAVRPKGSEFSVFYRTRPMAEEESKLNDMKWIEFSKSAKDVKGNSYDEIPATDDYIKFKNYAFSVFDLDQFDQYQIKITMHTTRQTHPPVFANLRTIATS